MFDDLSNKLDGVLAKFRQRGLLTEPMVREGLREVRRVLLEADVNYQVTREFLKRVQERALGDKVLKSVSPGQQIVKIVHDELVTLLGGDAAPGIQWAPVPPTVIMVVGLQGSGKTTTVAKLAKRLARQGKKPLMAACDLYRPAAVDQLVDLGAQVDLPVHSGSEGQDVLAVAREALSRAKAERKQVLLLDTAGRLQIDEPMMDELRSLKAELEPQEILLVADAMTGQEAVNIAEGFDEALELSGVILTKMDGDARGGAALSIHGVTGRPIKFVGVGEGVDA
ncbi:MAG: signal recognition particle receptor subunit alpha, partial [Gemmatimonadota bacterium]